MNPLDGQTGVSALLEMASGLTAPAVVPVLVGPLQVLLAILPGLLLGLLTAVLAFLKPAALKNTLKLLWRQKIQVAAVAACVAGLVWAGQRCASELWRPPAAATAGAGDWPMARGSLQRLGAEPNAQGPNSGGLVWCFKKGTEGFYSSPAVVGNRVYIASAKIVFESGRIYCFDADTGEVVWTCVPQGYRPTFSSPVVVGNYLVCGEGLHVTRDSRVICLDAREGKELWSFRTNSHVECTPFIYKDKVYVGAGDDGYYCFKLEQEPGAEVKPVWHVPGDKVPDAETALAVHDGKVYAGLGKGGKALCVLDAETGAELQRVTLPFPVFTPPAISDGKLYLGMGEGDYIHAGKGGAVKCFDLATLQEDWSFPLEQTVLGSIAVDGNQLFCGSLDGNLYCLSRAGKLLGKFNGHAPIAASPALTSRYVYFVSGAGMVYCLDRSSLERVWEFRLGTSGLFISSPVVARGHLYVGSEQHGLICAGEAAQAVEAPLWPGHLGGAGAGGSQDNSPLPDMGLLHWQYPLDTEEEPRPLAPIAALGEYLYVPLAIGSKGGLACLNRTRNVKKQARHDWFYQTANSVFRSLAVSGDLVLVVDGKGGEGQRHLHAVTGSTGKLAWKATVEDFASGVFVATHAQVFVQDGAQALSCLDLQGQRQWTRELGRLAHAPTPNHALLVAAIHEPAALAALDSPTGRELWRVALSSPAVAAPVVTREIVYVCTAQGVEAHSVASGQPAPNWKLEGGGATAECLLLRNELIYTNTQGEVVRLEREDGSVISRTPGALPGYAPTLARGAVLYPVKGALARLPLEGDDGPSAWMDLSALSDKPPSSPLVLHDSCVYFGLPGCALVRAGKGE